MVNPYRQQTQGSDPEKYHWTLFILEKGFSDNFQGQVVGFAVHLGFILNNDFGFHTIIHTLLDFNFKMVLFLNEPRFFFQKICQIIKS